MRRVFIGLENINPDNLLGAKKRQNKITEYRHDAARVESARVITYAGYILGFPNDTLKSMMHDIDVIKRELPIDLLEFFMLTPLPGSEDHLKLFTAGVPLDPDMNRYDLNHICTAHPKMSRAGMGSSLRMAWQRYYTIEHVETILRRVASTKASPSNALFLITWFMGAINIERIHPLESGLLRLQIPPRSAAGVTDRAGLVVLSEIFCRGCEQSGALGRALSRLRAHLSGASSTIRSVTPTPTLAMTPVAADETETHELFGTDAARALSRTRSM